MASLHFIFLVFCLFSAILLCCSSTLAYVEDDRKVYIVYMGALPFNSDYSPLSHHRNILQEVIGSNTARDSLIRSYGRSFNGFAARLTKVEREKLAGMEGVVSVFPSTDLKLQTTRSWDFMGLGDKFKLKPKLESDTIVGVIDTGIWPESQSFMDKGLSPPPQKWKGACKGGSNFTCNNKVIGARYYIDTTARDYVGHGTHTSSIAAGNEVEGVSLFGLAQGTARGGVPSARIAMYKTCNNKICSMEAVLAAFDDAIADGVDVITISIGGDPGPLVKDPIAIGAFHAMEKGILTVNPAGNNGFVPATVAAISPWILSVAASSTDRKFVTKVVLGNGKTLLGSSINVFGMNGTKFPLAYGKTASSSCSVEEARRCNLHCFDSAKGKILVCDQPIAHSFVQEAGAVGLITNQENDGVPLVSYFPFVSFANDDYKALLSYIDSTENPEGAILKSEMIKDTNAPLVAPFSSRGPNIILGDILKPDITAPGVSILAAYSPSVDARSKYYFATGTSMSCPHAAGVAAYVKTVRPNWSPSAIKSAIMTTAWAMNASRNKGAEFAYGSGHLNPTKAADPGLVYEATKDDYIKMMCALNYTAETIRIIAGNHSSCPKGSDLEVRDLNYPSMTSRVSSSTSSKITFSRTVTNVGTTNSTYKAQVTADPKLSIKVEPDTLSFDSLGDKKSFTVTVAHSGLANTSGPVSASLVWSDGSHFVRSPIVLYSWTALTDSLHL